MRFLNFFQIIFYLTFINALSAQDILWDRSYGGKHAEYLLDAQPTADYGFILAGSSLSNKNGNKTSDNNGDLDYWIWKMSEHGEMDWQKSFGGPGADMLYSVKNTSDGGFILAGTSESGKGMFKKDSCRGNLDIWIIKLNAKGNEEWQKTIGGAGRDIVNSICQTADGGYIIGGSSDSGTSREILSGGTDKYGKSEKCRGGMDFWIVKLDNTGEIKWQRTFGGLYMDVLESISTTTDGGCIAGGYSNSPMSQDKKHDGYGEGDYWIIKLDKEGNVEWQRTLGGEQDDHLYTILQTNDGGYIAAGDSASATSGNKSKSNSKGTDFWIVKLDSLGDVLWQETYNTGQTDILTSAVENSDGTILIGGHAQSERIGSTKSDKREINDYIAIKISAQGKELWKESIGSSGADILRKVIETRDGGYILAGTSDGKISRDKKSGNGGNDFWVVKLKDKDKKKEDDKKKIEAIPNPATQFTNIIVGFEFNSGTLSVFDLSGRQLQSFTVDSRTVPLDLGNYPEGIYVVEVRTDKGTESVKVLKSK
ncbi:hypothetical protein AMR72_17560 [Flavobacterium psychrophilum]|nr:hypothetical protein AMR72_17560 [Flavobacterium psychrophilum]AOE54151.1 hypothetical protein ALW18_17545 [Flavobacterium psychrophilum]